MLKIQENQDPIETVPGGKLRVGAWCVDTALSEMTREGATVRLEPRTLRLLMCLTARPGSTVSADELLASVWPGVVVTPDSVYQAIASLRRLLGDDPKQPSYIITVPRQGYRMVAEVAPWNMPAPQAGLPSPPAKRSRRAWLLTGASALAGAVFWLAGTHTGVGIPAAPTQRSVAVLPFADLTDGMGHETFADGMTEELIDRFSRLPGLKVPGPTSSFYYKGKQKAPADIARELGVSYILDGSVRKSGGTLRVAARLIKADSGFIVWSGSYDKPVADLLMVQDDIADAVAKALAAAMEKGAAPNPAPRPENRAGQS